MKRRFLLLPLLLLCAVLNNAIAQAPIVNYNTPIILPNGTAVGTSLTPTNTGGAINTTFGYSNTSTQPFSSATFSGPARGGADPSGNVFIGNFSNPGTIEEFGLNGSLITASYGGFSGIAPTGIVFDSQGYMYILVVGGNLYRIDPSGIFDGVSVLNFPGTTVATLGLAIDASDNLYVTYYDSGGPTSIIYKVPNTFTSSTTPTQYINTTISPSLNYPADLGFDSSGELFVLNYTDGKVLKYVSGASPGAGTLFTTVTANSYAMRVDPINNYVYVSDNGASVRKIYVYNTTGTLQSTLGGPIDCRGMILDGFGGLYAPDFSANIVYKYSPTGTSFLSRKLPTGLSFTASSGAITGTPTVNTAAKDYGVGSWNTFGGSSNLVNITVSTAPVISYATPQSYQTTVGITPLNPTVTNGTITGGSTAAYGTATQPLFSSSFSGPSHSAVDASGNIYVSNYTGGTISKFTSAGALVSNNYIGGLTNPAGMVFDSGGNMFVMSATNGNIYKYSPAGAFLGSENVATGTGMKTYGLAIDASDNMYVTAYIAGNTTSYKIYKVAAVTYTVTSYITTTTNLNQPIDVDVDAAGVLYVANSGNGTIYTYATAASTGTSFATGLTNLFSLRVDPVNKYVYAATNSSSVGIIKVYNTGGTVQTTISSVTNCQGLGIDGLGNIYASDFTNNKIYRYSPTNFYYINTILPTGLSISNTTGSITGTPTQVTPATNYTITGWNSSGGGKAVVSIGTFAAATWTGTTSNDWSVTTNWTPNVVPDSSSFVVINTATTTRFPQILSGSYKAGSITIGTSSANPSITVNGTLTVTSDITFRENASGTSAITATLGGTGSITANNLYIDNTTGGAGTGTGYNLALTCSVTNLTLNNNLWLKTSQGSTTILHSSTFTLSSGATVSVNGVASTNSANALSTFNFGSGTLDILASTNVFAGLTTARNALTLPTTIGYTGNNNQTVYANATAIANTTPATSYAYTNIIFGGTGIKTPSGALTISGNFTNTLANDASNYANFTTNAITFSGGSAQTLAGGSGTGTTFYNATFSGNGVKTISSGKFAIGSSGVLTLSGSTTTLTVGASGTLTLNSDAVSSARVATITGTSAITGTVNVQRFLTGGVGMRGYRTLSSPVYGGTDSHSNKVYSINYVANSSYITGTTTSTGGIDRVGNPTLYLFRQDVPVNNLSFTGGNFRGVGNMGTTGTANTTYTIDIDGAGFSIPIGNGFLFFFRGDRSVALIGAETVTSYIPTNTVLTAVGTLNQGSTTITMHDWFNPTSTTLSNGSIAGNSAILGYNLAGNPYASPISWTSVYAGSTAIGASVYEFNPMTNNYGAYVQGGGAGTGGFGDVIGSGQGFFVVANTTGSPTLNFTESMKSTSQPSTLLMGIPAGGTGSAQQQYIHLKLSKDDTNYDDVIVAFKPNTSSKFSLDEDGLHLAGNSPAETLTVLSSDSVKLSIDYRSLPTTPVYNVGLYVSSAASGTFKFSKEDLQGIPAIYDIWLKDRFLNDSLDMRANATYSFIIDKSNAATFGSDRFQLVFRQNAALALHLLDFTGDKLSSLTPQVQVNWKVENEANYTTFYVQRSTDGGKTFQSVGSLQSDGSGTYTFVDKNPVTTGTDEYRLQMSDINNNLSYSSIINIQYSTLSNSNIGGNISLYPNPAHDMINVSVTNTDNSSAGSYTISITNGSGKLIKTINSSQPLLQSNVSDLLPGTYFIQVTNNTTKTLVGNSKFVKL